VTDHAFVGSIPDIYDRCLGPLLFRPYAEDLAARLAGLPVERALELAAGTGIATDEVARSLPAGARIVATDLNQAMLDTAAQRVAAPQVEFRTADAQDLPFADGAFDAVFSQFGVMFLPDKQRAYGEMRRVLSRGGTLVFSVWDRIEASPITATVADALARCFPDDPPRFMSRVPHGYHDPAEIREGLRAAGFAEVTVEAVTLPSVGPSARDIAIGFCQGTPMRHEITARDAAALPSVTDRVYAAVVDRFGDGVVRADMTALVVTAR
jgi:ubiquinone/menaquinone biosynthesis C-methylase UbiE